ncbi:mandelate racemase/muconate lactonizing enzyme family protein [Ruania alba]|uniref:L-alanine-DL-glutamate epimerase n=1 Tax=Ruania alba TaxID=648782 RepID=A0A1H5N128_9MICO|nr:mandelate racemase/muconate lactonizing enzyme family protein [Ruania alba]SEE95253.1 L-alanine-DL-glutamate epimerase [Ruania alba]
MTAITGVSTRVFRVPFERLIGDANDPIGRDTTMQMVVKLHTDDGLTGMAIGHPTSRSVVHSFAELLVGEDPAGVKSLWQRMVDRAFKGGTEGIVKEAICHLDVALWDLKAKANEEPLWKALGASSPHVRAYASGIDSPLTDSEIDAFYRGMAARGITLGKLKVGRDREGDLRRLDIMREALASRGKEPELTIDSNEYWTAKEAIDRIREIERHHRLTWVEEPARRWDVAGLRKVSEAVTSAVATGENLNGVPEFLPLIQGGAVDIVQVGQYTTGITGALRVAELASAYELPVATMNCPGDFMAHIGPVLDDHLGVEVVWGGMGRLVNNHQVVEDGWITLPDLPGLGLTLRDDIDELEIHELPPSSATSTPGRRRRNSWSEYSQARTTEANR